MIMTKIGMAIKLERKRQGISQGKLAELAGITQATLSLIENDHRSPTIETLIKLAGALQWSLDALIQKR